MSKAKNLDYPAMSTLAPYTACETVKKDGKPGTTHVFLGADEEFYSYFTREKKGTLDAIPQVRRLDDEIHVDIKFEVPRQCRSILHCRYPDQSFEELRQKAEKYFKAAGLAEASDSWRAKSFQTAVLAVRAGIDGQPILGARQERSTSYEVNRSHVSHVKSIQPTSANAMAPAPTSNEISEAKADLTEAIRTIAERKARHNAIVRRLAKVCEQKEFNLSEDASSYDCLAWKSEDKALLFEIKTIAVEDTLDAHKQIRRAIGQLKYYKHFAVQPKMPEAEIIEIIVCESKPADALIKFCETIGVSLIWETANGFIRQVAGGVKTFEPVEF